MSSASADSQACFSMPRVRSTSSDEPTLITIRRNWPRPGATALISGTPFLRDDGGRLFLDCDAILVDDGQQRAKRFGNALARRAREQQGLALGGALQPCLLLLQQLRAEGVDLAQRDD